MQPTPVEIVASSCFIGALLHSFFANRIESFAARAKNETLSALLHFAGEIEVVFGLWAAVFTGYLILHLGFEPTLNALEQKSFHEPIFVFVIMVIAASQPILTTARSLVFSVARLFSGVVRIPSSIAVYGITLLFTPLLGSIITEPAAMTVSALLLKELILDHADLSPPHGKKLLYGTVATLFVNISIGGTLTSFAAPPILMIAKPWNWDSAYLFLNIGWKAAIAVIANTLITILIHRKELSKITIQMNSSSSNSRLWIQITHFAFLCMAILSAHHPVFLVGVFLFFIGFTQATPKFQDSLKIREALLVSFFLAGLVVLTAEQGWWLSPILTSLSSGALFVGASALTAITDNAALTSLAAQVQNLSLESQHAIVEGAVVGGGLTLIANAPNPAGYAILRDFFSKNGSEGLQPLQLFIHALIPTLIAGAFLWIL